MSFPIHITYDSAWEELYGYSDCQKWLREAQGFDNTKEISDWIKKIDGNDWYFEFTQFDYGREGADGYFTVSIHEQDDDDTYREFTHELCYAASRYGLALLKFLVNNVGNQSNFTYMLRTIDTALQSGATLETVPEILKVKLSQGTRT